MIQRRLAILVTCTVVAGAVAYFVTADNGTIGEMRVRALRGPITLEREGSKTRIDGEVAIQPGDVISTGSQAQATLRLSGDRIAWLADHTAATVVAGDALGIGSGHLLADAEDGLDVSFDGVSAHAEGSLFRIDQGVGSARAASYGGHVRLSVPGQPRLRVGPFFEAPIAGGRLPRELRPLQLLEDEWDRKHLGSILDLDYDLTTRGDGLQGQLGGQRPPLDYFEGLAKRPVGFMKPLMKRSAQELLIGWTIANTGKGGLKKALRRTFELRDQGGRWGIVAAIQEAKPKAVVARFGNLILATGVVGGSGGGAASGGDVAVLAFAPAGSTIDPGTGLAVPPGDDGGGNTKPPPDSNPSPTPPPPDDGCGSTTDCLRKDVEDRLSPEPEPSPTEDPLLGGVLKP